MHRLSSVGSRWRHDVMEMLRPQNAMATIRAAEMASAREPLPASGLSSAPLPADNNLNKAGIQRRCRTMPSMPSMPCASPQAPIKPGPKRARTGSTAAATARPASVPHVMNRLRTHPFSHPLPWRRRIHTSPRPPHLRNPSPAAQAFHRQLSDLAHSSLLSVRRPALLCLRSCRHRHHGSAVAALPLRCAFPARRLQPKGRHHCEPPAPARAQEEARRAPHQLQQAPGQLCRAPLRQHWRPAHEPKGQACHQSRAMVPVCFAHLHPCRRCRRPPQRHLRPGSPGPRGLDHEDTSTYKSIPSTPTR